MYVKGVGPARAAMLEAKGLKVVEDLLVYAPFRYEDRSNVKSLRDLAPGEMATVLAEVRSTKVSGFRRRNLGLFEATFTDASRGVLAGKWFHGAYLADVLIPGQKIALFGKVEFDTYSGHLAMMHPEYEILADDEDGDGEEEQLLATVQVAQLPVDRCRDRRGTSPAMTRAVRQRKSARSGSSLDAPGPV